MFYAVRINTRFVKRALVLIAIAGMLWGATRPHMPQAAAQIRQPDYKNFESPQVHPLALTPDGTKLLAVNSPDNRLSVFDLTGPAPALVAEIPVGGEPVSVIARNDHEAWVTNWLSDSVSVVDLTAGNVVRTIEVGDEPTDVIFAGVEREMAFVCVSGLGQVKVYNADSPFERLKAIDIRGKQPRALARDSSGGRVFVSVFESGNQTTVVPFDKVTAGGGLPKAKPKMSKSLPKAPETSLIVKWNGSKWVDSNGKTKWSQFIPYTLADIDLVVIDASSDNPNVDARIRGVGTHIGNSTFDSAANKLYVANTESLNLTRFESKLKGRFINTRVSTVSFRAGNPDVDAIDLNPHINYDQPDGSDQERAASLAMPADIARASDGTLYVAAMGSAKVGVLDSTGAVKARVDVGEGPTGLALDEAREQLYVLNRFEQSLSVVDLKSRAESLRVAIGFNPEPASVREGRRFLYDAGLSAHGDVSCASCHLNGHRDGLAWDLGDPQGGMQRVFASNFHPMKGPMTTQSLRGIIGTEPLHWRGDRASLADFNPAFQSLLGAERQLTSQEMAAFEAFVATLTYPPNPNQNLDRSFPNPSTGASAARGQQIFNNSRTDGGLVTCNTCHTASLFSSGTNGIIIPGLLLQEPQDFKVPQLRGLYQKTGMRVAQGEQLAGYGFIHDGTFDTLMTFLRAPVFTFRNDDERRDVEAFLLAFDSGVAPAIGLQVTVSDHNKADAAVASRINLLMQQADIRNCELIVKGVFNGVQRGFLYVGGGRFQSDRQIEPAIEWETLVASAGAGAELTFTGVPVGAGRRLGIDRDRNGALDGDE